MINTLKISKMKTANLIHIERVNTYFMDNEELQNPTPDQKLMASIFGEVKTTVFETAFANVEYNTQKELQIEVEKELKTFKNYISFTDEIYIAKL